MPFKLKFFKFDCEIEAVSRAILLIFNGFAEKEIIIVFQTTFSVKECKKCAEIIQKVCTNPIYFDTICTATQNRQDEAMLLIQLSCRYRKA